MKNGEKIQTKSLRIKHYYYSNKQAIDKVLKTNKTSKKKLFKRIFLALFGFKENLINTHTNTMGNDFETNTKKFCFFCHHLNHFKWKRFSFFFYLPL